MSRNVEIIAHWGPEEQTSFFIDHWRRNEGDLILWPTENGTPRIHVPVASMRYFEIHPLQGSASDDVLVEDSWFPRGELPEILGRYMRAAAESAREAKAAHIRIVGLWELVHEWEDSVDSETRADAARLRELLRVEPGLPEPEEDA